MTNEEKKAILYMQRQVKIRTLDLSKWQNGVKVLLNLIEKQSKEIEELKREKEKNKEYKKGVNNGGSNNK